MLLKLVRSVLLLVELITSPRFSKRFPWPCLIQARCSRSWSHLYRKRLGVKGRRGREERERELEPHPEKDYSTCSFISWSAKCPLLCLWMENGMEEWAGIYRAFEKQLVSACAPNMPSTSFNREKASFGFYGAHDSRQKTTNIALLRPQQREKSSHISPPTRQPGGNTIAAIFVLRASHGNAVANICWIQLKKCTFLGQDGNVM